MNSFFLSPDTPDTTPSGVRFSLLRSELQAAKSQPVFRTWVPEVGKRIVLCTTNEKVHLGIGKLSAMALCTLAKIFEEQTQSGEPLVFGFEEASGQPSRNLFVTASMSEEEGRIFHLAPGH